jgi:predicted TIM-barrel enzyme
MSKFLSIFPTNKPVIGMVHFKGSTTSEAIDQALREIDIYERFGLDGVILETYFGSAGAVKQALSHLKQHQPGIPYGLNILNVDTVGFVYARDYRASFVQVDSVVGHVKPRDEESLGDLFAYCRQEFGVPFMGGVRFKYQQVLSNRSLTEDLAIAMTRCDAVCVTAEATGQQTPLDKIAEFRSRIGDFPLFVCSGVRAGNAKEQLQIADGAVIGSAFKDTDRDSGDVSPEKITAVVKALEPIRVCRG